jgi:phospholipase/carboxylesterase
LTGTAELADEVRSKPPVLLVHGAADQVVPVAALHMAERELKRLGVRVRTHISPTLGHSVDEQGLRLGAAFLQESLRQDQEPG